MVYVQSTKLKLFGFFSFHMHMRLLMDFNPSINGLEITYYLLAKLKKLYFDLLAMLNKHS